MPACRLSDFSKTARRRRRSVEAPVDQSAAESFIWRAARLLDRHRYTLLFAGGSAEPVLEALRGYRNDDGGFGHALEPDLRCPGSQPAPTLHALGVLNEAGAAGSELARDARAWIVSIAEDGASHSPRLRELPHAPVVAAPVLPHVRSAVSTPAASLTRMVGPSTIGAGAIETAEQQRYWLKNACRFDTVPDEQAPQQSRRSFTSICPTRWEGTRTTFRLVPERRAVSEALIEAHLDAESGSRRTGGCLTWPGPGAATVGRA